MKFIRLSIVKFIFCKICYLPNKVNFDLNMLQWRSTQNCSVCS